ncbi:hypothetical protein HK103_001502 [Boothiomyces macroporosus]|uniref:Uncharacterized protein n=1 Tax=Boothiomyces macroporosus TaxID=261099 RepID=A0AAD5UNZ0_9FUNG|nr:hypothetical protein HK103_001502 [Boothiomyces macroporosus]
MQVDTEVSEPAAQDIHDPAKEAGQEGSIARESTINSNSETLQSSNNDTIKSKESLVESTATTKEAVQIPLIYMHSHHPTKPLENRNILLTIVCKDPDCPMNKPHSESGVGSSYVSEFSPEQQQELSYQYLKQYYEQYNQSNEYQTKLDQDTLTKLEEYLNVQSKLRERDPTIKGPDAYNVEIFNDDEEVDVQSSISQQDLLKRRLARNKYLEQFGQPKVSGEDDQENRNDSSENIQPQIPNGFGFPNNVPFGFHGPPFIPGYGFAGHLPFAARPEYSGHAPFGFGTDFPFQQPGYGFPNGFHNYDGRRRGSHSRIHRPPRGPRAARGESDRDSEYPPRFNPHDPSYYAGYGRPPFQHGFPAPPPQPPAPPKPPPAPPIPPTFYNDFSAARSDDQHIEKNAGKEKRHRSERRARRNRKTVEEKPDSSDDSTESRSTSSHSRGPDSDLVEPSEFADGSSNRSFEDEPDHSNLPSDSSHTYNNPQMHPYGSYPYPYQYPQYDFMNQKEQFMQNLHQHHGDLNSEIAFKSSELAALEAEIQAEIIRKQIELGNMPNRSSEERNRFKEKAMELVNLQLSLEKRRAKAKAEIAKVQAEMLKVQADQVKAQAEMARKRLDQENRSEANSAASVKQIKEEAKTFEKMEKGFLKEASKLESKARAYDDKIEGFDAKMKNFDEKMKKFDTKVQEKVKKAEKINKAKEGFFTRWTNYFKGEVQKEMTKAASEVQKNLTETAVEVSRELTNAAKEVQTELGVAKEEVIGEAKDIKISPVVDTKTSRETVDTPTYESKDSGKDEFPKEVAEELENAFAELLTKDPDTEVQILNSKPLPRKPMADISPDNPKVHNVETNYKVKVLGSDMKVKKVTGPGKFILSVTVSDEEDNN